MQVQIGFIVEQALGHRTHGENLHKIVSQDPSLCAHWAFPAWETHGLAAKIPGYRSNWTVRAGLRTRRALTALNRKVQLDALFFHTQVTAVLSPDWLRKIPSIVSLDATPLQYDSLGAGYAHQTGPAWIERLKRQLHTQCFREARRIVTWSEWARQGLIEDYAVPGEKIFVIPPGVEVAQWQPPEKPHAPREKVKILFVGGDLERKGGLLLVEAFRRLQQERASSAGQLSPPALELHLVTHSSLPPEPGIFVHHGLQPNTAELKQLFYEADIFCLPSLADCLPMVLSEAGAARLPLVSTHLAAIPELVRDGESGFLVRPGDLHQLVEALRALVHSCELRERMGRAAENTIHTRYDANRNVQALISLIKEIGHESQEARILR